MRFELINVNEIAKNDWNDLEMMLAMSLNSYLMM